MKLKKHHVGLIALVIVVLVGGFLYYESKKGSNKSGKHPINQKHGSLKCWLSSTCPWCKKQVDVFESEGIEYESQTGSPPEGSGVPQCQSKTTGKVCKGFKKLEHLWECLG